MTAKQGPLAVLFATLMLLTVSAGAGDQRTTEIAGGLVVVLGLNHPEQLTGFNAGAFLVQGLDVDPTKVEKARKYVRSKGMYGNVSVSRVVGRELPYAESLVNLIIAEDLQGVSLEEVMRVLVPGGMAIIAGKKHGKPRSEKLDEWTHHLHGADGNAVSTDEIVGPPRRLRWAVGPSWTRHHELMSSFSAMVSAGGRVYYVIDEGSRMSTLLPAQWRLIARDAFNGKLLWKKDIPYWHSHLFPLKTGPEMVTRRLAAHGDRVYVRTGTDLSLHELDGRTGETTRIYEGTQDTEDLLVTAKHVLVTLREARYVKSDYEWENRHGHDLSKKLREGFCWTPERVNVVKAFERTTGKELWSFESPVAPQAFAADDKSLIYHDGNRLRLVRIADGREQWATETPPLSRVDVNFAPNLILGDNRIFWGDGKGKYKGPPKRPLLVYDRQTGKQIWQGEQLSGGCTSAGDLFVIGDRVWSGLARNSPERHSWTGYKITDGSGKTTFRPDNADGFWFHPRCHRAKATTRYFITGQTGIEFTHREDHSMTKDYWVRGTCLYGLMPANGLTYVPPHPCACYMQTQLNGFNALAAAATTPMPVIEEADRLEKGPAYGAASQKKNYDSKAWPMYRRDNRRSSYAPTTVAVTLKTAAWEASLPGELTAPVVAEGLCVVSSMDTQTIYALDQASGEERWSFTAEGPIDSAPTFHNGRLYFGSSDGFLYCLRASDGALAWRYLVAPSRQRIVVREQLESAWPVHGSILIHDNTVHAPAGRSAFLDGGIRYCRIDADSGKLISETTIDHSLPDYLQTTPASTGVKATMFQDKMKGLSMPPSKTDLLSADDEFIYMGLQQFSLEGKRTKLSSGANPGKTSGQIGSGRHLISPAGFLDDSWFHRNYWFMGKGIASGCNSWFAIGRSTPSGRILAFDDSKVSGYGRDPRFRLWTTAHRNQLFLADLDYDPKLGDRLFKEQRERKESIFDAENVHLKNVSDISPLKFDWRLEEPDIVVRAMCMSEDLVFVAGPPNFIDEHKAFDRLSEKTTQERVAEQQASFDGKKGTILRALSRVDGKVMAECRLEGLPVFDGMAIANDSLFITMSQGRVVCLR